ncbi:polysaccharide export protein, partial [bacterium]
MKKPFSSPARARRAPLLAVLGGAFLVAGSVPIWAQTTPDGSSSGVPAPAPAFSAPAIGNVQAVGPNFKLQPGDVLAVQVANHPEMSAATVAVSANGKLNLPVVGALTAQGKTIGQVSTEITRAYSTQLKRPQVSVTLVSSVARQLVVRGTVAKPGPIDVRNDLRLSEVIAAAGGLMVDGVAISGNEAQATLVRGKATARPLDLGAALSVPQSPANLVLKAGDVINVTARALVSVALAGDGVAPSVVKIRLSSAQPQVRVNDVLKAGGSLKSKPEQTRGFLLRNGQKTPLDVNALFNGGNPAADLVLQSGDQLNFETIEIKKIDVSVVSLDGSVKLPGNFTFENEASALRTLVQAGGFAT